MASRPRRSRSTAKEETSRNASPRLRSRSARRSGNLSGLDLNPENDNDEEFRDEDDDEEAEGEGEVGEEGNDDGDDEEKDQDDDEDKQEQQNDMSENQSPAPRRGRGRPPGAKNKTTLAKERMGLITPKSAKRRIIHSDDEDGAPRRFKRGFKGKRGPPPQELLDEEGNQLALENDEAVMPEDEQGELKCDQLGNLSGGREYRVRTFKVEGRGERLYMLSTEPARCMGFRDSYLLFQKHRSLYKLVLDKKEKFQLIERKLIPHSYKGRIIALVTARSIFREFGAKIVVGGKKITDDYYEAKAREAGDVEGEIADPTDIIQVGKPYNQNQYVAWHGATSVYSGMSHSATPNLGNERKPPSAQVSSKFNDKGWMYDLAINTITFDKSLLEARLDVFSKGFKDPYSGHKFVPLSTQPSVTKWKKVQDSKNFKFEQIVAKKDLSYKYMGLSEVDASVFEHLDDSIKQEILKQQEKERIYGET